MGNNGYFGSGLGNVGTYWKVDPDAPQTPPNPMDDHFLGSWLKPRWSILNQQTGQTISVANSLLTMLTPYTLQARVFAVLQPITAPKWKVRAKMIWENPDLPYHGGGIFVRRVTSAAKECFYGQLKHTSSNQLSAYMVRTNNLVYASENDCGDLERQPVYLEVEYDGTNLIYRTSSSGLSYGYVYQEAASTSIGGAPEYVGIGLHPYSNRTDLTAYIAQISFDWFRRVA